MWKRILEYGSKLFRLTDRVGRLEEADLKKSAEIQKLHDGQTEFSAMLRQIVFELQRDRDNASAERRILILEIENRVLRMQRGLPQEPTPDSDSPPDLPRIAD